MSWIESHQSLLTHRKTLRAVALLKVHKFQLIGHLHAMWWWGLDNADIDGNLMDITEAEIAVGANWPDKGAEKFVVALVQAGFLDVVEDGRYRLHNWYKYAGKLNVRRESDRQRQKIRRASDGQSTGQPQDIQPSSEGTNRTNQPTVPTEGSKDPSAPGKRGARSSKPPADAVQPSEFRYITEPDILRYEVQNPSIRIRDMIQSYIDWQAGEKSPHRDQIRGFDFQLSEDWRREKFRKPAAAGEPEHKFVQMPQRQAR